MTLGGWFHLTATVLMGGLMSCGGAPDGRPDEVIELSQGRAGNTEEGPPGVVLPDADGTVEEPPAPKEKESELPPGQPPSAGGERPKGSPVEKGAEAPAGAGNKQTAGPGAIGKIKSDFDAVGKMRAAIEKWQDVEVALTDPLGEGQGAFDSDPRQHQGTVDCMTWAQQVLADAAGGSLDQLRYYGGNVDYATRKHYLDRWLTWDPWPLVKLDLTDMDHQTHDVTVEIEKFRSANGYRCGLYRERDVDFSVNYIPLAALEQTIADLPPDFYVLTGIATPSYIERFGAISGTMGQAHMLFLDASLDEEGQRPPVSQMRLHHASISAGAVVADPLGQYLKDTADAFAGFVLWRVDPILAREPLAVVPMPPCEFAN